MLTSECVLVAACTVPLVTDISSINNSVFGDAHHKQLNILSLFSVVLKRSTFNTNLNDRIEWPYFLEVTGSEKLLSTEQNWLCKGKEQYAAKTDHNFAKAFMCAAIDEQLRFCRSASIHV